MKAILAKKIGMTQVYDQDGKLQPVTVLQAGPCTITQLKTNENDGYEALQLGYDKAKNTTKAAEGHFKKSKKPVPKFSREVRTAVEELSVGDELKVDQFEVGDLVKVTGVSKGKGFTGTVKRYNFSRGPMTHGSKSKRALGSIGSMYPQKVFKGKKMPGRSGHDQVTVKNLKIAEIDIENNTLAIVGAIPGPNNSFVVVKG